MRFSALEILAILSPTPDLGSMARELLNASLLPSHRKELQRLIASTWPEST